jgi:hypothetical protein
MQDRILQGSIKAIRIPEVVTFLNYIKKTGVLTVEGDGRTRKVYFHNGEMAFASSSDPGESLGSFLVRRGKITQEQNLESVSQIAPGRRQGRILVAMGLLTPSELWENVQSQVLEIIYALFPLKSGFFQFEEMDESYEEKITLSHSATNIILEGVRRMDEWPRIKQMIPDDQAIPMLEPPETRDTEVELSEEERKVLELVDGTRSVAEIIRRWPLEEFEARRSLVTLIMARYVFIPQTTASLQRQIEEDAVAIAGHVESFNEIASVVVSYLGKRLSAGNLRALIRHVSESVNVPELAGAEFDGQGHLDPRRLLSNVAEYPAERRKTAVAGALSALLSGLLVASDQYLNLNEKKAILRMAERMAASQRA